MRVGVFGLGEAGSLFAADLFQAGVDVRAYDPAPVPTPAGVLRFDAPQSVVEEADVILALTAAADAREALDQALDVIPTDAVYADVSTAAASLKQALARRAKERGIAFADVALLAVVPGNGLRTRALASGAGADRFVTAFAPLGMPVDSLAGEAGDAATRKLLRSVFMKGLAALMIEALQASEKAGLTEWLWDNLAGEIARADETLLRRLVSGTGPHALRRLHEMEASTQLLEDLGVDPLMTRSTTENLRRVLANGLPDIPEGGTLTH